MTLATISVMTFAFSGAIDKGLLTDTAMMENLEAIGMDGIEPASGRLLENPKRLAEYRAYLRDSRLKVTCLDAICSLVTADAAHRQRSIDEIRASIDLAAELGCPVVLAAGSKLRDGIAPAEGRGMIADALSQCVPHAQQAGVTLAIEDFGIGPTLQCAAADCLEVLDAAPGLEFVFDTGNFYLAGEDPLDNFERLAPRTCHVHIKDWRKSDAPVIADVAESPIGAGLVPNDQLVRRFVERTRGGQLLPRSRRP